MRLFVTGATGFVGSAIVPDLLAAGHEVVGLARSDTAAATLVAAGATVLHGTLDDPDTLRAGAARADGVLHLTIARGDTSFTGALDVDRRALAVLGAALGGSDRPLVFASATSSIEPGRVVTERDTGDTSSPGVPRTGRGRGARVGRPWRPGRGRAPGDAGARRRRPARVPADAALPGADVPASSAITRELPDWRPTGPDILTDLRCGPHLPR